MTGIYDITTAISSTDAAALPHAPPARKIGMAIKQELALPTIFN